MERDRGQKQELSKREIALESIKRDYSLARSSKDEPFASAGFEREARAKVELALSLGIITQDDADRMDRRFRGETKKEKLVIRYHENTDLKPCAVRGDRIVIYEGQRAGKQVFRTMTQEKFSKEHLFSIEDLPQLDPEDDRVRKFKRGLDAALAPRKRGEKK